MKILIFSFLLLVAIIANAASYDCKVEQSLPVGAPLINITVYERKLISSVSRCLVNIEKGCSLSPSSKVLYNESLKSKKFYNLKGQSDFQIFSDLKFIDNDGQGVIRIGTCKITSP